jgi:3-phytase
MTTRAALLAPILVLSACAQPAPAAKPLSTVAVTAAAETAAVATTDADAADDPAIWRNPADPAASLIVGTDKKAGLHVYGLDGTSRDFADAGRVNNVDIAVLPGRGTQSRIIVAASDRNDEANAKVVLFELDPVTAKLTRLGRVAAGKGEAYGICLQTEGDQLDAFVVIKDGTINQLAIDLGGPEPSASIVRTMKLGSQSEGCVVDGRTKRLYVAEEDVGLWRFDAARTGSTTPIKIAAADGKAIVADAEGVAIAAEGAGDGGYLVVSSQGDNAYAVYRLSDDSYVGRFRIAKGSFGATSETDGIEIATGDFGPQFPGGLMVAQDGDNAPRAQNFKLVDWAQIKAKLGLP